MTISVSSTEEVTELFGIPLDKLPTYSVKAPVGNKPTEVHDGVNHELLDEILSYVKAHPETWRQEAWFKIVDKETGRTRYDSEEVLVSEVNSCGASFCFAGHVAIHEGFPSPPVDNNKHWIRTINIPNREYPMIEEVSEFAVKRLGISDGQADALFSAENSLEDLEAIVEALHLVPNIKGWDLDELRDRPYLDPENYESDERVPVREYLISEGLLNEDLVAA